MLIAARIIAETNSLIRDQLMEPEAARLKAVGIVEQWARDYELIQQSVHRARIREANLCTAKRARELLDR